MDEEYCSKCFAVIQMVNAYNPEVNDSTMVKYKDTMLCFNCFEKAAITVIEEKNNGNQ